MNTDFKFIGNFFKSMLYTLGATIGTIFTIQTGIPMILNNITQYEKIGIWFKGFGVIKFGFILFINLFFIIGSIVFAIKAIYTMWLCYYYAFVYKNAYNSIKINVDENNVIQESYMEFKNGNKIPIEISRIQTVVPDKDTNASKSEDGK